MPDRSRFKKNTLYQYGLQAAKYLFPFITLAYLARALGVEAFAVRSYVLAVMEFMLVFLDFGFISYGTAAIAKAENNIGEQNSETSTIMLLRLLLCIIGGIALVPITLYIPILAAHPFYVALAYFGTCLKALLPDFVFQGREDMGIITSRFVVTQALAVVLIFIFVHRPEDLLLVAAIEAVASAVALIWSWANVLHKQGLSFVQIQKTELKRVLKESSTYFVASAATTIYTSLTTLFIGYFILDQTQIAYWSIAMTVVVAIQSLYAPIANSLFPHMVKRADFALFKNILVFGTPLVTVVAIIVAVLNEPIMLVLGGQEYLSGSYVIALASPLLVFSYPAVMMGYPILAAVGWVKELTATSVATGIFHITGMVLLVAFGVFNINTVAVLRCCTEVVLMLMRAYYVLKFRTQLIQNSSHE